MADKSFDAIIIGGGNKGLVTAMYLQRYGGMEVGIFERRHEVGGSWASEEAPAPGFTGNPHATTVANWYTEILEEDFPTFKERGFKWIPYPVPLGAVFLEDESCIAYYSPIDDPNQERTAKELSRFSQRDAESWLGIWQDWKRVLRPAFLEWCHNPPNLPGVPDAMEKALMDPKIRFDPSWIVKSPLEVMRDLFEDDGLVAGLLRTTHSWLGLPPDMAGGGVLQLTLMQALTDYGCWLGGTHTAAHAAFKVFVEDGGKSFTKHEVEKVLIQNGKAVGIKLVDGTEIEAKRLVVSTLDPYSLCFRLIGKENLPSQILRRVEGISRWRITITWYSWALHELPNYKASSFNPDINRVGWLSIGTKDPYALVRNHARRALGQMPEELNLVVWAHTVVDPTQAPPGKHVIGTEDFVLRANALTEKEWREFKRSHAEAVIKLFERCTTNMSWDNVIGYDPLTPLDCCRELNMGPEGNWAVIDHTPGQMGRCRPIPELARHKTPIKNLYATGAAWHPSGGAMVAQGYNCYKIISEDFGLEKPWEKKGRPY